MERAATTVVHGAPEQDFADAYGALHEWIERTGDQATPFERELYIDCDGSRDIWVTELQAILEPERGSFQTAENGPLQQSFAPNSDTPSAFRA